MFTRQVDSEGDMGGGDFGQWWARTFEPEGSFGYSGYGGEEERRQETKANEPGGANFVAREQEKAIKAAEAKAEGESSTNAQAIARARQKALAAATAAQGRGSTIKTGSSGLIGDAAGTQKQLIGE